MKLGERVAAMRTEKPKAPTERRDDYNRPGQPLSTHQRAIIERLAQGVTQQQVAEEMGLAHSTVRSHVHAAYRRLDVVNLPQAWAKLNMTGMPEAKESPEQTRQRLRGMERMAPKPKPFLPDAERDSLGDSKRRPHEGVLADVLIAMNLKDLPIGVNGVEDCIAEWQGIKGDRKAERDALVKLAAVAMDQAARLDHRRM